MKLIKWIFWTFAVIIGIAVAVSMIIAADTTPATEQDFQMLRDQVEPVKEKIGGVTLIENTKMVIELENEECKIKVCLNENFEVETYEEIDKAPEFWRTLVISLLVGFAIICMMGMFWDGLESSIKKKLEKNLNKK